MQRPENTVAISEVFLSLQGEGVHAGAPAVFLRTYHCNLTCSWCDSKYTWQNQERSRPGVDYEQATIESILRRITAFGCKHLVLTGGEPMLNQRSLVPLLSSLKAADFFIEVETNGTIAPTAEFLELIDCFNVSPKTSNSGVDEVLRTRPQILKAFAESHKAWFKFVIGTEADILEVEEMLSRIEIPRERVLLMPEGTDAASLLKRGSWLAGVCKEKGLRFTPRLHILLYGNTRGT